MILTERQIDFFELAELMQTADQRKQDLVMQFVHRIISMQRYNELYAEIDDELERLHFRYIAKYKVFDRAPKVIRSTPEVLLQLNKN